MRNRSGKGHRSSEVHHAAAQSPVHAAGTPKSRSSLSRVLAARLVDAEADEGQESHGLSESTPGPWSLRFPSAAVRIVKGVYHRTACLVWRLGGCVLPSLTYQPQIDQLRTALSQAQADLADVRRK